MGQQLKYRHGIPMLSLCFDDCMGSFDKTTFANCSTQGLAATFAAFALPSDPYALASIVVTDGGQGYASSASGPGGYRLLEVDSVDLNGDPQIPCKAKIAIKTANGVITSAIVADRGDYSITTDPSAAITLDNMDANFEGGTGAVLTLTYEVARTAYDYMRYYKVPIVFAAVSNDVGQLPVLAGGGASSGPGGLTSDVHAGRLTFFDLASYINFAGGEVFSHSQYHRARTSTAQLTAELAQSKADIEAKMALAGCPVSVRGFKLPGAWYALASIGTKDAFDGNYNTEYARALIANYDYETWAGAAAVNSLNLGGVALPYRNWTTYEIVQNNNTYGQATIANMGANVAGKVNFVFTHSIQAAIADYFSVAANHKTLIDAMVAARTAGTLRLMTPAQIYDMGLPGGINVSPVTGAQLPAAATALPTLGTHRTVKTSWQMQRVAGSQLQRATSVGLLQNEGTGWESYEFDGWVTCEDFSGYTIRNQKAILQPYYNITATER